MEVNWGLKGRDVHPFPLVDVSCGRRLGLTGIQLGVEMEEIGTHLPLCGRELPTLGELCLSEFASSANQNFRVILRTASSYRELRLGYPSV